MLTPGALWSGSGSRIDRGQTALKELLRRCRGELEDRPLAATSYNGSSCFYWSGGVKCPERIWTLSLAPGSSAAFTPNKRKILVLRINRDKFYIVLLLCAGAYCLTLLPFCNIYKL